MAKNKRKMGIMAKLLLGIIPVIIIGVNVVSYVSGQMASNAILEETNEHMTAVLDGNVKDIDGQLDEVRTTAELLSLYVGDSYKTADMASFARFFKSVVSGNELISGAGIWFEPKTYTGGLSYAFMDYVGPYWYKDGANVVETWDYSNAEYDYFAQEYYRNAKAANKNEAIITDPYYDPTSNSVMATCSTAIINAAGEYVGCITVDISLDTINTMVGSIKVGRTGCAVMTAGDGTYIYSDDSSKVSGGANISADNNGLQTIASAIVGSEKGNAEYTGTAGKANAYFESIPQVNWKLILMMDNAEINEAATQMIGITLPIAIAVMVLCAVAVIVLARSISKPLVTVKAFAEELATGNFTVDELAIRRADEIGEMGDSLNEMYHNNRDIIANISEEAGNINDASSTLSAMSEELSAEFGRIQDNMVSVNEAMMNSSAGTQQVSASVTEVNNSVARLAEETERISAEVKNITERAHKVQQNSIAAHDSAIEIAEIREKELNEARSKATVVKEIENLANVINDIASEIDLLSLNASIEAARAGEAGRGFAVVAQQINKLATETAEAVHEIQGTIAGVQDAFQDLGASSEKLLEFVTQTATPDYSKFTEIGRQYGEDANLFGELSDKIAEMIQSIKVTMDEVNSAVANIANGTEETATRSADVTESVNSATSAIDSIAEQATSQMHTAGILTDIVKKFKLR
ncbi:MAG: methyl-accepting chemotaxis protein [Lachnospiraceae bacterium]|nr:methyl-accepting chemotaxis protein [Lachnospiraceae bacterium]